MVNAHGNIHHTVKGCVVINQPNDAFNCEGVLDSFTAILDTVAQHQLSTWWLIECITEDLLATADAFATLAECFKKCKAHGCQKVLLVDNGYAVTTDNALKAIEKAGLNVEVCSSLEQAQQQAKKLM